jgi:hypothetical protein
MSPRGRRNPIPRLAAMRRKTSLLACIAALAIAGCGSSDGGTIPPDDANNLLNQLEAVQSDVRAGDCENAQQHAQEFVAGVNALPSDVDHDVASELTKAADNLRGLTEDPRQCASGASGEEGAQTTETTDTTETDTTAAPTTTPTTTTTTEEATTTDEPSDSEQQPDEPVAPAPPAGQGNQGDQGTQGPVTPTPGGDVPSGGIESGGGRG